MDRLAAQTAAAIQTALPLPEIRPGKFSVWLKFVRLTSAGEESIAPPTKQILTAATAAELTQQLAENALLAVFGAEVQVVQDLPNLIVKVLDRKATVPMPGAPPLDQAGQVFLKATVYEYSPGLWEKLFGGRRTEASEAGGA